MNFLTDNKRLLNDTDELNAFKRDGKLPSERVRDAAPDLLDALKAALSDIEWLCERLDEEVGKVREFDRIVEDGDAPESYKKIMAAIEKAEG